MRKNSLNWKLSFVAIFAVVALIFTSCDEDDDGNGNNLVEDGVYLSGTASGYEGLNLLATFNKGYVEGEGFSSNLRDDMYEKFIYLATGNLSIVVKAGASETTYGVASGTLGTKTLAGESDQINGDIDTFSVAANGAAYNVAEAGFYHIIWDKTTNYGMIAKVDSWGIIGDATDKGWSGQFEMTGKSLSASSCEWEITNLTLRAVGGFKFRYNNGWKILADDLVFFANVGKTENSDEFQMGGGTFPSATEGAFTVKLSWTPEDGFAYTATKTGEVEPLPEYPEALYLIGDGVGDWVWANTDLPMIPVNSKPYLFWKIVWIKETGGFKFSPVKDWNGDFGKSGDATNGYYKKGSDNLSVPGTAGYYMVVVNLEKDSIYVGNPEVYLIGDPLVGSWATANPDAKFAVDNANEVITLTKVLGAADVRIYAWQAWFTDWWQSEFIVLNNKIEYRANGGDQERVAVTAGSHKIDLNFKTGTGTIE
jgi:hypothetical protein